VKLRKFIVREFKSIWDSGPVEVDEQVTCLVGKNESGKTALLTALYRTNPIIPEDAVFDDTSDYPKREAGNYSLEVGRGTRKEAVVVDCHWELEASDSEVIANIFGPSVLKEKNFQILTYYGRKKRKFKINIDESAAKKHLAKNQLFSDELQDALISAEDWEKFTEVLAHAEDPLAAEKAEAEAAADAEMVTHASETLEAIKVCKEITLQISQYGFDRYISNRLIWPRVPKILYFDEYYKVKGQANLNSLIEREDNESMDESDRSLLGLMNLAQLDHRKIVNATRTAALVNDSESAGQRLTNKIMKYWSQNKHIQIKFEVREGRSEDPEGMQGGTNLWVEIQNTQSLEKIPLDFRSHGFVWFLSFLARHENIKRENQDVIILLDEPGLSLHGSAQGDLLKYFDKELSSHQLIYTTHSPFMIDPRKFGRVRIVQDLGVDKVKSLSEEQYGTKVLPNIYDATGDSLFPLQAALGYEIHQTLFVGPNILVVEGPSDLLYLQAISCALERDGRTGLSEKWTITPVGGSGKVSTFVSLLVPQRGMNIAALLDIQSSDRQNIENLYKSKMLKKKQVLIYAKYVGADEADLEDMFDREFYIKLINLEFKRELSSPVKLSNLNNNQPRVLAAVEAHLSSNPFVSGLFSHYRPARCLSDKITDFWQDISDDTKKRFEELFNDLNNLLK